jgi:hypothetical protein
VDLESSGGPPSSSPTPSVESTDVVSVPERRPLPWQDSFAPYVPTTVLEQLRGQAASGAMDRAVAAQLEAVLLKQLEESGAGGVPVEASDRGDGVGARDRALALFGRRGEEDFGEFLERPGFFGEG